MIIYRINNRINHKGSFSEQNSKRNTARKIQSNEDLEKGH